jgi:hypothetical protein
MTRPAQASLPWEGRFLAALGGGMTIKAAAKAAHVTASTAYWHRTQNARFADDWERARAASKTVTATAQDAPRFNHWRKAFLEALAETSNVTASAARANVPVRTVYKLRREDGDFAGKWLAALHEGYDNLEMELLGYFRSPNPGRKIDVASALRLLTAHRETVARQRALREDGDEQAVLDSIDAFIEDMRQRRLANEAILVEAQNDDGEE